MKLPMADCSLLLDPLTQQFEQILALEMYSITKWMKIVAKIASFCCKGSEYWISLQFYCLTSKTLCYEWSFDYVFISFSFMFLLVIVAM